MNMTLTKQQKTLGMRDKECIWHPFAQNKIDPMPLEVVRAKGAKLYDAQGKTYYDLISSWWVALHGHCHPYITMAIANQAAELDQVIFAKCTHPKAVELVERLLPLLPGEFARGFYSSCGSTAVEVGLKMAYQFWQNQGKTERKRILAFEGGYHGDTFGAMAVGRSTGFYEAYAPLLHPVSFVPFAHTHHNDAEVVLKEQYALEKLDQYLEQYGKETAAFIYEPLLQGSGGMRVCRPEFMEAVLSRLKDHGIVLIADEIMTGFGRTGTMFAGEQINTKADIICISKGLTNGSLPLALTCCTDEIYQAFYCDSWKRVLAHSGSFDANPIACAAACASLDIFEQDSTLHKIAELARAHHQCLNIMRSELSDVLENPRSIGVVGAIDLKSDGNSYFNGVKHQIAAKCLESGMLLRPLGSVIYLLTPACLTPNELEESYTKLIKIVKEVVEKI